MRLISATAIFLVILAAGAAASDEWTGTLVDADCTHRGAAAQACEPGADTTSFGLVVAGRAYLFNKSGSQKASAALKRFTAILAADPAYPHSSPVQASVTGKRSGNTLIVDRIDLQ